MAEISPCFFHNRDRAQAFLTILHRLVWEYNFVNQTFVHQYRLLHSGQHVNEQTRINDIFIFGGAYSFSRSQISAIVDVAHNQVNHIKGLQLNFTRIQNHGVKQLCQSLNRHKWKAIRLFDVGLYALDLTNNFIDDKGFEILALDLFKVDPKPMEFFTPILNKDDGSRRHLNPRRVQEIEIPVHTSVRILTIDHNFMTKESLNQFAKVIAYQK